MTANEQHATEVVADDDKRTNREVMRQYDRLRLIKAQLVRGGVVNGDATPADVLKALRSQIPADLL